MEPSAIQAVEVKPESLTKNELIRDTMDCINELMQNPESKYYNLLITFDGKPSPVHLDGVLTRHKDIPFAQLKRG